MEPASPRSISVLSHYETEPLATYCPPATFQLDTTKMVDGEHRLRLSAVDALGTSGIRIVRFTVRNGPGITVTGLRDGSTVHGVLDIDVNSFGGDEPFDPERAESHGPIPVWTWVMTAVVAAWEAGTAWNFQHARAICRYANVREQSGACRCKRTRRRRSVSQYPRLQRERNGGRI